MKNLILLITATIFMSSCALFKNKEKNIDNIKTEIREQKTVVESEIDTSTFKTYSKITYGGVSNPFKSLAGIQFATSLNNLASLNLNSKELEGAIKNLSKDFKNMLDAAEKENKPTTEENWSEEKKGKSSAKKTDEDNNKNVDEKKKEIITKGIMESIPWYVWLGALIILIVILVLKKK